MFTQVNFKKIGRLSIENLNFFVEKQHSFLSLRIKGSNLMIIILLLKSRSFDIKEPHAVGTT
jgi:hypothetical protein